MPVRLHRSDIVDDILGGATVLNAALKRIREAGAGVVVYLRDGAAGVPLKEDGAEQARQKHWLDVSAKTAALPERRRGLHW
jgi:3,4-dihydroxy 2-butanone 4-phosphate synthase/GTP cyclohydrolase II